ncbi:MAG: hypothetical protein COC23_01440 [Hyphomicrobiales bacterium]|nr:MAG: hypothetical protein COC23_01440 [Hyphomicrobiales bacterium]
MRRANIVSGLVLALFGIVMLIIVIPMQIEPGPEGVVSPSLVPNITMIVLTALSILLVVNNLRKTNTGSDPVPISHAEIITLFKFAGIFAVSIALFLWVSPLAAGATLMVSTLLVLGERRPVYIVALPSGLLLMVWFLFYKVLGTAIL